MKIISKFKDYYDFLQGIYGVDERLILDRRDFSTIPYTGLDKTFTHLHVGEYQIDGVWLNGRLLFGEEIEQIADDRDEENWIIYSGVRGYWKNRCLIQPKLLGDSSPTWSADCPILRDFPGDFNFCKQPILKEYGVQKFLPPEKVWQWLSAWLGKKITRLEPPQPIGDDKTRILSHGFDLRESFRHRKKE